MTSAHDDEFSHGTAAEEARPTPSSTEETPSSTGPTADAPPGHAMIRQRAQDSFSTCHLIDRRVLVGERILASTKWFDYRFLSPLKATALFRTAYLRVYKWKFETYVDSREEELRLGLTRKKGRSARMEVTSLWQARQLADQLGVPYEFHISRAIELLMRSGWQRLPYLNQLYGKNAVRIGRAVLDAWEEYTEATLTVSKLPQYRVEKYADLPARRDHRSWVLKQMSIRMPPYLGRAIAVDRLLTEPAAIEAFGAERVARALEHVTGDEPTPAETSNAVDLLPACFAVPGAHDAAVEPCGSCHFMAVCHKAISVIERKLLNQFGDVDVPTARRKRQQRERTRKFRAREKAIAVALKE